MQLSCFELQGSSIKVAESDEPLLRLIEVTRQTIAHGLQIPELATCGLYLLLPPASPVLPCRAIGAADNVHQIALNFDALSPQWQKAIFLTPRYGRWSLGKLTDLKGELITALDAPDGASRSSSQEVSGMLTLLRLLGIHPHYDEAVAPPCQNILHCQMGPVAATARILAQGFLVCAGSVGVCAGTTRAPDSVRAAQQALIDHGVAMIDEGRLRFLLDHRFDSAAQASTLLLGKRSTGFLDWRRPDGTTWAQIERYIDTADEPGQCATPR